MKIIHNKVLPLKGYVAMVIGPWIFTRREQLSKTTIQHEEIHWAQQKELAIVGFYLLYVVIFTWELVRCCFDKERGTRADGRHRNTWKRAYYSNPFEREAYYGQNIKDYLEKRKRLAWIRGNY